MEKIYLKKYLNHFIVFFVIFFFDRLSKLYIIDLAEINSSVNLYITSFINLFLIWNKGVAFGFLSFENNHIYNFVTALIVLVNLIIVYLIIKGKDFRVFFLLLILGGSSGNLFDRLYYKAVPDFIDLHIGDFHWFIFNVADIFISMGVICLIFVEIFFNKNLSK
jgi:signal peptidase II